MASRAHWLQKSVSMAQVFGRKSPQKPKRAATRRKLSIPAEEAEPFSPQRAAFIWLKLVRATRDIGDEANMASMNENQWQIALNQYNINIEPGLSKKIFSMVLHRKGKLLFQSDFVGFVQRELEDREEFDRRAELTSEDLGDAKSDDNEEFIQILATKIVHALLEGLPLDVFELLQGSLKLDASMSIEELVEQIDAVEWNHRVKIMEFITQTDSLILTQRSSDLIIDKWSSQFSDERSQLVKVALDTCPVLVGRMLREGLDVDVSVLLGGLVHPIRAKRSKELQRLGGECGGNLMRVFLEHFGASDSDTESKSQHSFDSLLSTIRELCAKILENDKHEAVRSGFLSFIIQVIAFHKASQEAVDIFEDEGTASQIVAVLNVALNDRKPEVRDASFRFMKLLDKMLNASPYVDVREAIETNVLGHVDPSARLRFERKKKRANGRSRSVRLRGFTGRGRTVDDAVPPVPKLRPHLRSNSVPVEMME